MDNFSGIKCSYLLNSSVVCCEFVDKMKQYVSEREIVIYNPAYPQANLLQIEMTLLNSMQLKCNKLLDNFYTLKHDFDFLINEMLPIKYFARTDSFQTEEHINEFSIFAQSVWQVGKLKFSEKGKKAKYMSFTGYPFSEVTSTIHSFVDEALHLMNYTPHHYECASLLQTFSFQINVDLHESNLGSADACFHQLTYLDLAIPFLDRLCHLIHQYLLLPDIHTPKQFVDSVILSIPSIDKVILKSDMEDMMPYRIVINFLNGKLLGEDILDHNSDIKPVVEEDTNLKRSAIVMKAVEWILQQYFYVEKPSPSLMLGFADFDRCTDFFRESPVRNSSPSCSSAISTQRRTTRRKTGRASVSSSSNDLQPIKVHALQMALLPPLL